MGKHYDDQDIMRIAQREPLTTAEAEAVDALKRGAHALWILIDELEPSRETSMAKTKLEESVMWAVKGITA